MSFFIPLRRKKGKEIGRRAGARLLAAGECEFTVWGPGLEKAEVRIVSPTEKLVPMRKDEEGYWKTKVKDVKASARYFYRINGSVDRPDPASNSQPEGVHKASQVVDHSSFKWRDKRWRGEELKKLIMYELHVGTFTPEGTFEAVIPRLKELKETGINAVELMPVAQFPGSRNWGYDGTYPFAAQNSYGGPEGLKKLVDAAHEEGMSVILDVVYNHLGPEGNYLRDFGPYFTNKYNTPWGEAVNFDGENKEGVRNFFVQNMLYWFGEFHIDALRIDAIHGIFDASEKHILREMAEAALEFSKARKRKHYLIAESDLNEAKVVRDAKKGGYGIDAQWLDGFHHAVHALLTRETSGYYADFGEVKHLVKALKEGFVYSGDFSEFRNKDFGTSSADIPADRFVVFAQNHDQVGNRLGGDRLSTIVDFESLKLAAAAVFLSPYVPLIFMGEEYGETAPFLYFVSHTDPDLVRAVREGRQKEFAAFNWQGEIPDPQGEETFNKSKLDWARRKGVDNKILLDFYGTLIRLRKEVPALSDLTREGLEVKGFENENAILLYRESGKSKIVCLMNFAKGEIAHKVDTGRETWRKLLDSAEEKWSGPGSAAKDEVKGEGEILVMPRSVVAYSIQRIAFSVERIVNR